jgi:2-C-methyl-D-erythritol 4-phosphate cytidylyltransferase
MSKKIIAIVPAAGVGQRASSGPADAAPLPKQYRLLNGKPMLRWSVQALLADPRVDQVRVVVAGADVWAQAALEGLDRVVVRPAGGPSRAESVLAGLADAGLAEDDWVLVHDAARPGLSLSSLSNLINICLHEQRGGLLAQPVADTVKKAHKAAAFAPAEGCVLTGTAGKPATRYAVAATLSRESLWLAQTPQMFPAGLLQKSLLQALRRGVDITDEASAVEHVGVEPRLIPGEPRNFKVTWPGDFDLMEKWL